MAGAPSLDAIDLTQLAFGAKSDRRRLSSPAAKAAVCMSVEYNQRRGRRATRRIGKHLEADESVKLELDSQPDQLTRASALVGIFKGLHLLFADSASVSIGVPSNIVAI